MCEEHAEEEVCVSQMWKLIEVKHCMRLGWISVGSHVRAAVILFNLRALLYSNQISQYFDLSPPPANRFIPNWPNGPDNDCDSDI